MRRLPPPLLALDELDLLLRLRAEVVGFDWDLAFAGDFACDWDLAFDRDCACERDCAFDCDFGLVFACDLA